MYIPVTHITLLNKTLSPRGKWPRVPCSSLYPAPATYQVFRNHLLNGWLSEWRVTVCGYIRSSGGIHVEIKVNTKESRPKNPLLWPSLWSHLLWLRAGWAAGVSHACLIPETQLSPNTGCGLGHSVCYANMVLLWTRLQFDGCTKSLSLEHRCTESNSFIHHLCSSPPFRPDHSVLKHLIVA